MYTSIFFGKAVIGTRTVLVVIFKQAIIDETKINSKNVDKFWDLSVNLGYNRKVCKSKNKMYSNEF